MGLLISNLCPYDELIGGIAEKIINYAINPLKAI